MFELTINSRKYLHHNIGTTKLYSKLVGIYNTIVIRDTQKNFNE